MRKWLPQVWSDAGKKLCGASFWRLNNWEDEKHKFYSALEAGSGDPEGLEKVDNGFYSVGMRVREVELDFLMTFC